MKYKIVNNTKKSENKNIKKYKAEFLKKKKEEVQKLINRLEEIKNSI